MTTLLFPILASLPVEISDGLADKLTTLAGYVLTAGAGGLLVFVALRSVSAVSGGIRSMITPQPAEGYHWSADGMVHVPDGLTDDEYSAQLALEYQGGTDVNGVEEIYYPVSSVWNPPANSGGMSLDEYRAANDPLDDKPGDWVGWQDLDGGGSDLRDDARNEEWEAIRDEVKARNEGSSDAAYNADVNRVYAAFERGEINNYAEYEDWAGTREEVANMERENENDAEKALREAADSGSSIDWSPMSRRA